jgi:hypothetical protein
MDFYVVMGRPGARVARRKRCKSRVGFNHRVKKEDTQAWFKQRVSSGWYYVDCATIADSSYLHAVRGYSVGQVDDMRVLLPIAQANLFSLLLRSFSRSRATSSCIIVDTEMAFPMADQSCLHSSRQLFNRQADSVNGSTPRAAWAL